MKKSETSLIAALAVGANRTEAARASGLSLRTIARRMADPDFRGKVQEAQGELVSRTLGKVAEIATEAVETLHELLGEEHPASVRLGASRAILEHLVRLREHAEIVDRVSAIEAQLRDAGGEKADG